MKIENIDVSEKAERILVLSAVHADKHNKNVIGVIDLVAGMILDGDNLLIEVLKNYGANIKDLEEYFSR